MTGEKRPRASKKYFTLDQANAALPLVRAIVNDIAELALSLRERQDRLARLQTPPRVRIAEAYREELEHAQADFERDQERLAEYVRELGELGAELKDFDTGLVDFPCRMDGRDVYLCWRLGELEVSHWHELDAGFAGRKKIVRRTPSNM
jgi:hypothetical protein